MELALFLHDKGKPLVCSLNCHDPQQAIADAINAARLHGHAQLITSETHEHGGTGYHVERAKARILAMAKEEGELEVKIQEIPPKLPKEYARGGGLGYRLDIYCKK